MKPLAPILALAATSGWLLLAPAAQADWTRVTSAKSGTDTGEVALLRLPDSLHMVWKSTTASYRHRIDHRTVAPDGTVTATRNVTKDWLEMGDPGLSAGPDGLRVLFGGLHTAHPDETNTELNTAVSVDGGVNWGLQDGSIIQPGAEATDAPVSAAAQADGLPLATWASPTGTWTHRSVDVNVPAFNLQASLGGAGTRPGVATVGARTVVAWYSSGSARGVYAQEISPGGTAAGAPMQMPGTSGTPSAMPGRTPVAARVGGKVFVAYATGRGSGRAIVLWLVGSGTTRTIARVSGPAVASVSADPSGRLWVAWTTRVNGRDVVRARQSDASARTFGDVVDGGRPGPGAHAGALDISPVGNDLDVVAGYTPSNSSRMASYYSRIGG